ncbi:MFS transporter [Candidatus Nesciobacter abundans]|nr:MFS transporter [Candidatus Nesciobacter abundans]
MDIKKIYSSFWTLSGSMLEYYDYMLFTYMIPVISANLFGGHFGDSAEFGYALMLIAALFRPLGAMAMGYIGDVFGRKKALFLSIVLISFASMGIGLLPSYQYIGFSTVILLLIFRVLQAMSAGGDLNGSAIFLIEHFGEKRAGLASGVSWAFVVFGMALASLANYVISKPIFQPNGWRWAFIIGGSIGFVGMLARAMIIEGEGFKKTAKQNYSPRSWYPYLSVIGIGAGIGGMYYYSMVYCFNFLKQSYGNQILYYQTLFFVFYAAVVVVSGILTDYFDIKKVMFFSVLALLILAFPCLLLISYGYIILSQMITVCLLGIFVGPSHNLTFQLFPPKYRYRYISLCYGIGTSIVGSATPYLCTKFSQLNYFAPSLWMSFCAFLGMLGVYFAKKSPTIDYED